MSQQMITIDDRTGNQADSANPSGWLRVRVDVLAGGEQGLELDFAGWKSFREWVELSDPDCGKVLTP
jgi:hypothetical protein